LLEALGVEVDVGDGREERVHHEAIDGGAVGAARAGAVGEGGDAAAGVEEQILESGGLGIFAARAEGGAAGHLHGLFTLVAKHGREHVRARPRPP